MDLMRTETYKQLQALNLLDIVIVSNNEVKDCFRCHTNSYLSSKNVIYLVGEWRRNGIFETFTGKY